MSRSAIGTKEHGNRSFHSAFIFTMSFLRIPNAPDAPFFFMQRKSACLHALFLCAASNFRKQFSVFDSDLLRQANVLGRRADIDLV